MKRVLLVALGGLALCGQAQASTVISADSGTSYPYQRWVDRARVLTPDVTLTITEAPCPYAEADGCTTGYGEVWVNPAASRDPRQMFFHELGHEFDYQHNTAALWGWDNERFAETYSVCAMWRKVPWGHRISGLSGKAQRRACRKLTRN